MSREIKDSGVEWIGKIPEDWNICKIDSLYFPRSTKVSDKDYPPLSVTMKGIVPQLATTAKTDDHDNRKLVKKGDFAINSRSDRRGSCGISEYDGSVSLINTVLQPRHGMNNEYYNWLFHSDMFSSEFYRLGHGIVDDLRTTSWQEMKKMVIPAPSSTEQRRIVSFLDRKCSAIDTAIEKTKKSIEKLEEYKKAVITKAVTKGIDPNAKMKDSGVEWIGEIPEGWEIQRGKFIFTKLSRTVKDSDDVITCFRDGEVTLRKNRREEGFTFSDKEIGYQGIEPGDLVVHGMDGFAGSIGISDSRGKATPVLNVLDSKYNKAYYMYYLRSMAYGDVFTAIATGIRVRSCNLNWNKLAELSYPVPNSEEQQNIVDFIQNKCSAIDTAIEKKKKAIDKWEEYKKSLIYYAVTGKIDCRNCSEEVIFHVDA